MVVYVYYLSVFNEKKKKTRKKRKTPKWVVLKRRISTCSHASARAQLPISFVALLTRHIAKLREIVGIGDLNLSSYTDNIIDIITRLYLSRKKTSQIRDLLALREDVSPHRNHY